MSPRRFVRLNSTLVLFLLTPLCEGRPLRRRESLRRTGISTHAPLRGATWGTTDLLSYPANFYSRPSARGDAPQPVPGCPGCLFLLTPLCEGRPNGAENPFLWYGYFYSRPSARGDSLPVFRQTNALRYFYSRPSARGDMWWLLRSG